MVENKFRLKRENIEVKIEKHGTHDQKTHGNWATGVLQMWLQPSSNSPVSGAVYQSHGRWVDAYYWVHGRQAIFFRQGSR
jgi:hypothetical protein